MKLEQQCKECGYGTVNAKSFSNHVRNGCNTGRDYQREHYVKNREVILNRHRGYRLELKKRIFSALGDRCSICGFADHRALQIDHVDGGGYKHRKRVGSGYYQDILKGVLGESGEYRLLCANCNFIQGIELGFRKSIWS